MNRVINMAGEAKEVVVKDFDGKEYTVEVGEMSYGQRCAVMSEVLKVKVNSLGQVEEMLIDYVKYEKLTTVMSMKRVVDSEGNVIKETGEKERFLNGLPVSEAKKIVEVALKLNPF